jgi:UDP-N-acetylmuramoyl-L-alanyl-D-glutamate--2,6-diaminopimelate ligase
VFCCLPGGQRDGHDFAGTAVAAGAVALVVERRLPLDVPQIVVGDARSATGHLAAALHGHPGRSLELIGVTGTNGKTTTSHLIAAILTSAGRRTEVIGTLTGVHTTPEAPDLQAQLARHRDAGGDAVVMEVSSHALALRRVVGCHFAVGVFTNLGRDHLDFHGTMERYFAAKALLFEPELTAAGVTNIDDVHGRLLADTAPVPMTGFSLRDARDLEVSPTSVSFTWRGRAVRVGLGGTFNAMNALAAATAASVLGIDDDTIAAGLRAAPPVPGRFESITAADGRTVVVDYAHTPDGLREVLGAVRQSVSSGRVLVVFGCGGDRDREKRPEMGAVAAELADGVIVTSDNPRSEDPVAIITSILDGVPAEYRHRVLAVDPDRRSAIRTALQLAEPTDVVVVAGKGHESTQTIGDVVVPFDDRAVVRSLLENPS